MKGLKNIRARFEYLGALGVCRLIGSMKRSSLASFSRGVGWIMYHIPGFGSLCVENIRAAFPEMSEKEVRATALRSIQNLLLTLCEFFWIKRHPDEFEALIDTEHCRECCLKGLEKTADGTGAILVTPHLGNWEFAGRTLAAIFKYRMATVVRTARNPYLDRLVSDGRRAGDVKIIYSKGAARAMKHAIDDGYTVGILIDQNTRVRDGGVFVKLFGIPIPVSRAPAVLARAKNRFVAIGTVLRRGDRFEAILRELPKPASEYESDEELIQALTDVTEEFIRMAPDQYLWMYKRFQHIPPDADEATRKRYPSYARVPGASFFSLAARAKLRAEKNK